MAAYEDTVRERNLRVEETDLVEQLNRRAAMQAHHGVEFEQIDRGVNLHAHPELFGGLAGLFEKLRRAGIHVAGKKHGAHAADARAVKFLSELDGPLQPFASPLIVPIVFQPPFAVLEEIDVFVAWSRVTADSDLIHHCNVGLRSRAGTTDLQSRCNAALQHMDEREALADVYVFQMSVPGSLAGRGAVGQIV